MDTSQAGQAGMAQGSAINRYKDGAMGRGAVQATQDAPAWDQMHARIGSKMEGLQQVMSALATALAPVLEQTGKNTPLPLGYSAPQAMEVPPPPHDSSVIEFMRGTERQIIDLHQQVTFILARLPFDTSPF